MSDNLIPVTSQAWERVKDRLEAQGYRRFAKYVEPADLGLRVVGGAPPNRNAIIEVLEELADLMDDVREGNYKPDSFTTQPAHQLLSILKTPQPEAQAEGKKDS